MLIQLALVALFVIADMPAPPPPRASPQRVVSVAFDSAALASRRTYEAYLPPGYDGRAADATYPVVVLLHGLGGEGADWFATELGDLLPLLGRLTGDGRIPPLVALAPDGGNGYWTDHLASPRERYGTFIDDVVDDAAARFAIDRRRMVIAGVSMGGHGAMSRALMSPERYRAVVSIAGALFPEPPTHRPIYKKVWGSPADPVLWATTAPMVLLGTLAKDHVPPIFLACGRADVERFLDWTTNAARVMAERGIARELVLTEGGHTWPTWRSVFERWLTWAAPFLR